MDIVIEAAEQETAKEKVTREWTAIREECASGGELSDACNLVAAARGTAELEVVMKRLSCGCILIPDAEELFL